jgi:hypothetical protein
MSVLRPKDGDYIGRGLLLLLGWVIVGWAPFVLVGALLAGAGGAALGLAVSASIGVALYVAYLKLDPVVYPRPKTPVPSGQSQ